jgi:hypothetical protein
MALLACVRRAFSSIAGVAPDGSPFRAADRCRVMPDRPVIPMRRSEGRLTTQPDRLRAGQQGLLRGMKTRSGGWA